MTLDEAITHEREKAKDIYVEAMLCHANPDDGKLDGCIERGRYHEQLADWLEELKCYKNDYGDIVSKFATFESDKVRFLNCEHVIGYRKAINDLVKEVCKKFTEYERNGVYRFYCCEIKQDIVDIAEQLKVGISND